MLRAFSALFALFLVVLVHPGHAADGDLFAVQPVNLYAGPSITYETTSRLATEDPFTVQARTALGNWVRVRHPANADINGWVQTGLLPLAEANYDLSKTPVVNMADADLEQVNTAITPRLMYATPVLPPSVNTQRLREIYLRGQNMGNDPHSIVKIGDCNTASGLFLAPIGFGEFQLGPYTHLMDTASHYADSFGRRSVASRDGFNVSSIFDPLWSLSDECNPNEPPLLCEYRTNPSSVAFMMFGQNDILVLTAEQYETFLRDAVERSVDQGVIPVLSTFTNRPENTENWGQVTAMNVITIEVAAEYDIPLINFWLAAYSLPGYGIGGDYAHLTAGGEGLTFTGREAQYGLTLYNLAVITMLDMIYHNVIEADANEE